MTEFPYLETICGKKHNAFPKRVPSTVKLYADDALIYCVICTHDGEKALQSDLNTLIQWSTNWQMVFNPDECNHLQISLKKHPLTSQYSLHGQLNVSHPYILLCVIILSGLIMLPTLLKKQILSEPSCKEI